MWRCACLDSAVSATLYGRECHLLVLVIGPVVNRHGVRFVTQQAKAGCPVAPIAGVVTVCGSRSVRLLYVRAIGPLAPRESMPCAAFRLPGARSLFTLPPLFEARLPEAPRTRIS